MDLWLALATGLSVGLASVPHCAGMCGPLAAFACARGGVGRSAPLLYQLGRTASYAIAGGLVGAFGGVLSGALSGVWLSALLSWSLAVALALAAWRLWSLGNPRRVAPDARISLSRGKPRPTLFDRALARLPKSPLVVGLLTAFLPCGALAAALLVAAGSASAPTGALVMLGFATTSALALLGVAWLASHLRRIATPTALRVLSATLLVGAVLLAVRPVAALTGDPADACCHTAR